MNHPVVFVAYPLSLGYRTRLTQVIGRDPEFVDLPTLRRLSPPLMIRRLRSFRGRPGFIALEDPGSIPLQGLLELLAVAAGTRPLARLDQELGTSPFGPLSAVRSATGLVLGSFAAAAAARRCSTELDRLLTAPRSPAAAGVGGVLYLNSNLWFGVKAGGSVAHVAGVVNALIDEGYAVDVAAVGPQPLVRPDAGLVLLAPPAPFGLPAELNQYRFHRLAVSALDERLGTGAYRFVYQRLSSGNYAGAVLARRHSLPLVLEYNGSEVWIARHWGRPLRYEQLARRAEEVSLRHAQLVVTVSNVLGDELLARGVDPDRLVVYPNGVDEARFDPERYSEQERRDLRRSLGVPPDAVLATFVGTFGRWHGVDFLAHAIRTLALRGDTGRLRFLLVGDGLHMADVRETLRDVPEELVTLTGLVPQDEAPRYLAASDVLLSPHVANADGSRFFGSPTKLFEYLAMSRPILAADLDQIGDVLQPSLHTAALPDHAPAESDAVALLAPPGDEEAWLRGLVFLAEREDWRQVLAANARRSALARYTWRHHVSAILERLDDLDQ